MAIIKPMISPLIIPATADPVYLSDGCARIRIALRLRKMIKDMEA